MATSTTTNRLKFVYILMGIGTAVLAPVVGPLLVKTNRYGIARRLSLLPGISSDGGARSAFFAFIYFTTIYIGILVILTSGLGAIHPALASGSESAGGSNTGDGGAGAGPAESTATPTATPGPEITPKPVETATPSPSTPTTPTAPPAERNISADHQRRLQTTGAQLENALQSNTSARNVAASVVGETITIKFELDGQSKADQLASLETVLTETSRVFGQTLTQKDDNQFIPARIRFQNDFGAGYLEPDWLYRFNERLEGSLSAPAFKYLHLSTYSQFNSLTTSADKGQISPAERASKFREQLQVNLYGASGLAEASITAQGDTLYVAYQADGDSNIAGMDTFIEAYGSTIEELGVDYLPPGGVEVFYYDSSGAPVGRYTIEDTEALAYATGFTPLDEVQFATYNDRWEEWDGDLPPTLED